MNIMCSWVSWVSNLIINTTSVKLFVLFHHVLYHLKIVSQMKNCLIEKRCQQMTHYCITDTETLQYRLRMPRVFTRPTQPRVATGPKTQTSSLLMLFLRKCLSNLKAEVSIKSYCSAWWNEFVIEAQGPAACLPLLRRPRFTLYNYSNGRLPTAFRAGLIIPNRLLPLPLLLWYTLR